MFMVEDSEIKLDGSTEVFRMQHMMYYEEGSDQPTLEDVMDSRKKLLDRIQLLIYGDMSVKPNGTCGVDFRTKDDELILIDDVSEADSRKFRVTIEKNESCVKDNVIVISDDDSALGREMLATTNIVRDKIMCRLIETRECAVTDLLSTGKAKPNTAEEKEF